MRFFKETLLVLSLAAFSVVNAQDSKAKAEKKMQWIDTDGNHAISKEEMLAFYKGKTNKKGKAQDGEGIFIGLDHNDDGKITIDELQKKVDWKKVNSLKSKAKVVKNKTDIPTDKVAKKLFWMDANKDNSVSLDEMKAFFKGKKNKKGEAIDGNDMFIGWDANDDGKVTVNELANNVNWKKINAKKRTN